MIYKGAGVSSNTTIKPPMPVSTSKPDSTKKEGTKKKGVPKPTSQYFVDDELAKLVPNYLNDSGQTPTPVLCDTEGEWPSWIKGSLVRVGSGRYTIPLNEDGTKTARLQHFFDALGMLHKFDIANGKVRYNSRYTTEGLVRRAKKVGLMSNLMMFGPNANGPLLETMDPCQALMMQHQSAFTSEGYLEPDELNINVMVRRGFSLPENDNPHSKSAAANAAADELVVQTEGPYYQVCDSKTLEPKRLLRYTEVDSKLKGFGTCAHPVKDRSTKEIFNYLVTDKNELSIFALDIGSKPSKLKWHTVLPSAPCYCHSLALTEKYVVFVRNPITMNLSDIEKKQFLEAFEYDSDCPTYFFMLDRKTGKHVSTFKAPNFMFFHSVNAYDYVDPKTGGINVHVDLCAYDGQDLQMITYREYTISNVLEPIEPFENGALVRYECANVEGPKAAASRSVFVNGDVEVPRATVHQAIHLKMELPRINTLFSRNPKYRYAYGVGGTGQPAPGSRIPIGKLTNGVKFVQLSFFASIVKTDWETGKELQWCPPNGETAPCEPIYVPRPGSKIEDDGCILTIVMDRDGEHSILVCLDATTMTEIARAHMPQTYSLAPHGTFVENDSMFTSAL